MEYFLQRTGALDGRAHHGAALGYGWTMAGPVKPPVGFQAGWRFAPRRQFGKEREKRGNKHQRATGGLCAGFAANSNPHDIVSEFAATLGVGFGPEVP